MMVRIIIIAVFLVILVSLGTALFHLISNKEQSDKTVKALSIRIGLSLLLFIFLFIAMATGLIKPHGIGANIQRHNISDIADKK
jgi:uncharacterized protein YacL